MEQIDPITVHGGATVNGVQTDTQVLMKRKGYDKWPSAMEGLNQWEAKVKAMDCVDHKLPFRELAINPQIGGFYRLGKNANAAMPATKTAYGHLMSYVKEKPDNVVNNLLALPPRIQADFFAYYRDKTPAREIVLRTAKADDTQRVIRATVTESHSQDKGDDLMVIETLRNIASEVKDSKLRVIRQWDYTSAELILPTVGVMVKGRPIFGRIQINNSETKGGSYETLAGSMVLVCLNGMTAPGNTSSFKVRHMGDIGYRVRQSIKGAINGIQDHLHQFQVAYETPLSRTRADILEAFGKSYELPESTGVALAALWDVDGENGAGDTLAGLVNAVTRFAQSQPVEEALRLEAVAGEVLHKGLSALI